MRVEAAQRTESQPVLFLKRAQTKRTERKEKEEKKKMIQPTKNNRERKGRVGRNRENSASEQKGDGCAVYCY